jgi:hypothetical protein
VSNFNATRVVFELDLVFDAVSIMIGKCRVGLQGHRTSVSALDPQLQALGDDQFAGPSQEVYLIALLEVSNFNATRVVFELDLVFDAVSIMIGKCRV